MRRFRVVGKPGVIQIGTCGSVLISRLWRGFSRGRDLFRLTLEELSARDAAAALGRSVVAGLAGSAEACLALACWDLSVFCSTARICTLPFQDCSILYADPVGYHIASQRALAANI